MQIRHRIPTVFTLYMIDVLCCALGCVILLWQVNYQEAEDQTAAVRKANEQLKSAKDLEDSLQVALKAGKEREALSAEKITELLSALKAAKYLETRLAGDLKASKDVEIKSASKIEALDRLAAALQAALDKSRTNENNALLQVASLSKTVNALKIDLKTSKEKEDKITLQVTDLRNKLDKANEFTLLSRKDYEQARKALAAAQAVLDGLRNDLDKLKLEKAAAVTDLAAKMRAQEKFLRDLKGADLIIAVLRKDLAARILQHQNAVKQAEDLTARLKESETNAHKLEQTLASLQLLSKDYLAKIKVSDIRAKLLEEDLAKSQKDILAAALRYKEILAAQELLARRLKLSAKDLDEAKKNLSSLQVERLALILQAKTLKEIAENRFAGIPLTGQNVLFLIDMSGSMAMSDAATLDPDKWPFLCDTVISIMKSLPELKQYQIILFSDRVRYPFGKAGEWLKYDRQLSPQTVLRGLKARKPEGETNMYAAFAEAFKFRGQKLDTIYVLSDGLPNAGTGLPANAGELSDQRKSEILSKYVRNRLKNVWNAPIAGQPRVRINTIGFFFESPDVGAFLWALAREHDGSFVGIR